MPAVGLGQLCGQVLGGRVVVDGDMTKLLALQAQGADPQAEEIARRINDITAR